MNVTAVTGDPFGWSQIRLGVESRWPETAFTLAFGQRALAVSWSDGPGQRAVLETLRTAGAGIWHIDASRTITPIGCAALTAAGVGCRDSLNVAVPEVTARDLLVASLLAGRDGLAPGAWTRGRACALAFATLTLSQLEIAVVLTRENPSVDVREVAAVARALSVQGSDQ